MVSEVVHQHSGLGDVAPQQGSSIDGIRPRSGWARELFRWGLWLLLTTAFLRPVLNTTIVADDFTSPFFQFLRAGPSVSSNLEIARQGVDASGHFNYVGQYLGALHNQARLVLASSTDVPMRVVYALTKLVVLLATALAIAAYVRCAMAEWGRTISAWQARVVVSVAFFGTLQVHIAWSNDPVASYPLSGFASAALGFALLTAALKLSGTGRWWAPWALGGFGAVTILFYEINVAAVAAVAVVLLWRVLKSEGRKARTLVRLSPAVLLPAVMTLLLQLRAVPNAVNYTGTSFSGRDQFPATAWIATLSSLPGAGWRLSADFIGGYPEMFGYPLGMFCLVLIALLLIARRHPLPDAVTPSGSWRYLLLAAPAVYALGAVAIQAATAKVQEEVTAVGMVYNFYAVSASAVAALLASAVILAPRFVRRSPAVHIPLLVGVGAFLLVQMMVNAAVSQQFNSTVLVPNRPLLEAYESEKPVGARCAAVAAWTAQDLPGDYEGPMVDGLQKAYEHFHGEPFCPGFVR